MRAIRFAPLCIHMLYFVGHIIRKIMISMANPSVALRLDAEIQSRLKALGKRRDRSPHYLMKEAVEKYLAAEEAFEAERDLMQARWERFELTGETLSHDVVRSWAEGLTASAKSSRS